MLGVFPRRKARLEVRRAGIGTHRKTEGARAARSAEFARLPRRAIASARSWANTRGNRRQMAEGRLLLSPVMIFLSSWFVWRFWEITGEIFFAHLLRTRRAGPTAGESAGRKSPVPKCQSIDFVGCFPCKKIRATCVTTVCFLPPFTEVARAARRWGPPPSRALSRAIRLPRKRGRKGES